LNSDYLAFLLSGIRREVLNLVEEAGHGTRCLRTDSWENFTLPLPPLQEQTVINAFLSVKLNDIEIAISRAEREIILLREYQTRLTADVVTGKLDVREAARRLPEDDGEPAEPEAADGEETLEESSLVEYAAARCRVG
jgi:type I restriction enzyme S subunit